MAVSSKQFVRARISRAKFRQLLKLFALDLTATQIAPLTGLNRNTVNRYLRLIRQAIAEHCQRESPFSGEVELDESYFGARRVASAASADAAQAARLSSSASTSATGAFIPRSCRTAKRPACKPLFAAKSSWRR